MVGLDTNVLLRLLLADDAWQSPTAAALLAGIPGDFPNCYVSLVVLCEAVWVATRRMKLTRREVSVFVSEILGDRRLLIQDRAAVEAALSQFGPGNADFADYLIGRLAVEAGCAVTHTFDRALDGTATFSFLG